MWAQSDIIRDIQTRQSGRGHRTAHRKADAGSPPPTRGPNCAQSVRQPETRWSPRVRCGPKRPYNNYLQSGRRRGAVTCHCERPKRSEAVPGSGDPGVRTGRWCPAQNSATMPPSFHSWVMYARCFFNFEFAFSQHSLGLALIHHTKILREKKRETYKSQSEKCGRQPPRKGK